MVGENEGELSEMYGEISKKRILSIEDGGGCGFQQTC
jgi:hypothetical protein